MPAIHSSSGSTAFNEGVTLSAQNRHSEDCGAAVFGQKTRQNHESFRTWGARGRKFKSARPNHFSFSLRCHRHMLDPRSQERAPSTSLRAGPGAPSSLTPQTWQPACHFVRSPKKSSDERRSFVSVESDPRPFQFLPGRASLVHNAASFTTGKPSQLRKQLESPAVTDRGRLRL